MLIADNSLITYDYGKNLVALLRWLKENPPSDIDYPTPVNQSEVCEGDVESTVEVAKSEDLELQYQYPDLSQGSQFNQFSDFRIRIFAIFSGNATRYARTFLANASSRGIPRPISTR